MTKKEMVKVDMTKALENLERVAEENHISNFIDLPPIARALATARGIKNTKEALEPCIAEFLYLQNDSLGFKTDNREGYDARTVKDCMAEALMRGVPLNNNCFNIIARNFYLTKNGVRESIVNWPGVTEFSPDVRQPEEIKVSKQKSARGKELTVLGAYMPYIATWKLNGVEKKLETTVFCRAYAGDAAMDALSGKAYRKGGAKVLEILYGHKFTAPEGELGEFAGADPKDITPEEPEAPKKKRKTKAEVVKEKIQKAAEPEEEARPQEAAEADKEEARPQEDPRPATEATEATEGQEEAKEGEEETKRLSKEGWARVLKVAKARWPNTYKGQMDDWVAFHYGLDAMELPLYAESEMLEFIKER